MNNYADDLRALARLLTVGAQLMETAAAEGRWEVVSIDAFALGLWADDVLALADVLAHAASLSTDSDAAAARERLRGGRTSTT